MPLALQPACQGREVFVSFKILDRNSQVSVHKPMIKATVRQVTCARPVRNQAGWELKLLQVRLGLFPAADG